MSEREIKGTIPFTIISERIKYLGINLSNFPVALFEIHLKHNTKSWDSPVARTVKNLPAGQETQV